MNDRRPGVTFEKAVASVQAQLDTAAAVTHDEVLIDRLGHARQFDVVIRGKFAGQEVLGVIECKDYARRVGSPEVDAFVTKAADINANLRMLISRRGFTRPALEKCAHYGIQALSLLGHEAPNFKAFAGTRWVASRERWGRVSVTLHFTVDPLVPVRFNAERISIRGKRVLDWFTNYLLDHEDKIEGTGWVVNIRVDFDHPQDVDIEPGLTHSCRAIEFKAERLIERFERMVGVSGTGFYDWNAKRATFPAGTTIETEPVPMDFNLWTSIAEDSIAPQGFLSVEMVTRQIQFERIHDAIDLGAL